MAELPVVHAAARNNAEWCDAFCRTYGIAGRLDAECWTSPERTPPLYPDAVTLVPGVEPAQLLSAIDTSDGCSLKDSFANLDLIADGFRVLFRGEWLFREPRDAAPASSRWLVIQTREQLEQWESMWQVSPAPPVFFRPALLAIARIAVLGRYDGDRIVAGAVANRSATVVGISNVFDRDGDLASAWRDAARAAQARWGPLPIVGYASGSALEAAHQAGYRSVGELVVWLKPASGDRDARVLSPESARLRETVWIDPAPRS
jgi:hypothetical protein